MGRSHRRGDGCVISPVDRCRPNARGFSQFRRQQVDGAVDADVQLAPGPALPGAVFLDQPFTGAAQLQLSAVDQQMQRLAVTISVSVTAGTEPWYFHCLSSPAEGGEGRHCQAETKPLDDRADQAFGLAQSQPEHRLQRQRRQDRQRRIPSLAATGGSWRRSPARDGVLAEPERKLPRWRKLAL